jgi:hypothetical protein
MFPQAIAVPINTIITEGLAPISLQLRQTAGYTPIVTLLSAVAAARR